MCSVKEGDLRLTHQVFLIKMSLIHFYIIALSSRVLIYHLALSESQHRLDIHNCEFMIQDYLVAVLMNAMPIFSFLLALFSFR